MGRPLIKNISFRKGRGAPGNSLARKRILLGLGWFRRSVWVLTVSVVLVGRLGAEDGTLELSPMEFRSEVLQELYDSIVTRAIGDNLDNDGALEVLRCSADLKDFYLLHQLWKSPDYRIAVLKVGKVMGGREYLVLLYSIVEKRGAHVAALPGEAGIRDMAIDKLLMSELEKAVGESVTLGSVEDVEDVRHKLKGKALAMPQGALSAGTKNNVKIPKNVLSGFDVLVVPSELGE